MTKTYYLFNRKEAYSNAKPADFLHVCDVAQIESLKWSERPERIHIIDAETGELYGIGTRAGDYYLWELEGLFDPEAFDIEDGNPPLNDKARMGMRYVIHDLSCEADLDKTFDDYIEAKLYLTDFVVEDDVKRCMNSHYAIFDTQKREFVETYHRDNTEFFTEENLRAEITRLLQDQVDSVNKQNKISDCITDVNSLILRRIERLGEILARKTHDESYFGDEIPAVNEEPLKDEEYVW